jgi:hypothetical protein
LSLTTTEIKAKKTEKLISNSLKGEMVKKSRVPLYGVSIRHE